MSPRCPFLSGRTIARIAAIFVWIGVMLSRGAAMQDPPPPEMTRTTLTGVFTTAQADKGQSTFSDMCLGCHKVSSHSGEPFKLRWAGKPVADLYQLIKDTMPEDAAGSLSTAEAIQIVAYLLKVNGMPPGTAELPAEAAVLKTIRIELPAKSGSISR